MDIIKLLKQAGIIAGISLLGEILHALIHFPIPASIYGILILLALLISGIVKPVELKPVSTILIGLMPMMFVPACVGLMRNWDILQANLWRYALMIVITTYLVMLSAGGVAELILRRKGKQKHE